MPKEVVVGFDIRIPGPDGALERGVPVVRPQYETLRSVDALIWPEPFGLDGRILSVSYPKDWRFYHWLWPDLSEMIEWLSTAKLALPLEAPVIAVTLLSERLHIARDNETIEDFGYEPANPETASSAWKLLGFDVGSYALRSYLFSQESDVVQQLNARHRFELQSLPNGLLRSVDAAQKYVDWFEENGVEVELLHDSDEPALIYGLYQLGILAIDQSGKNIFHQNPP